MKPYRHYSKFDQLLIEVESMLDTVFSHSTVSQRPSPAVAVTPAKLSKEQKQHVAALMRINHTGEVCAQALYRGQAFTAKSTDIRQHLLKAAEEENDHLVWCQQRIQQLGSRVSLLNLFWYYASFKLGAITGLFGDPFSLGFVVETENQVTDHLNDHLGQIPEIDKKSRAILEMMREDEQQHATKAKTRGAKTLPKAMRLLMKLKSKLMTKSAYYI